MATQASPKPESGYRLQDEELERALLSGAHANMMEGYFGEAAYDELLGLAAEAHRIDVHGSPRVLILPGIMGSKLGYASSISKNVIWIDPFDVMAGTLKKLVLKTAGGRIEPLGVILPVYLKLKLFLKARGYHVDFHPFDWRKDIGLQGRLLAERIVEDPAPMVSLVAHSMGGLVARGAMTVAAATEKVQRIVMLGTPNHGSFVPVQAMRGVYPTVRKIAALDLKHTATELAEKVFNTFPGLYQMLPWPDKFSAVDLYDLRNWPTHGPQPNPAILTKALKTQKSLAGADNRYALIAGINQETVTGLRFENDHFRYDHSREGDGTVPLNFAQLDGIGATYYIEETHGSLPNNTTVERAVTDILSTGKTDLLPRNWSPSRAGITRSLQETELEVSYFEDRVGEDIKPSELRRLLREFAAPLGDERSAATPGTPLPNATAGQGYDHDFSSIVVSRKRQHRIDVRLALGSITEVDARAYVLGVYRGVEPAGPAKSLNDRLGGLISEFTTRRMINGNLGEVFLMPVGRYPVQADMVLLTGLGPFDSLTHEGLQLCAENTIRTFIRSRIDEFATVLLGAGSGLGVQQALENLVTGLFRGLRDADQDRRFRRITLCENNPDRFEEIKRELYRLASTPLFEDVEVTFDEVTLPAPLERIDRDVAPIPDPVYLIVRRDDDLNGSLGLRSSLLTSGGKATVITGVRELDPGKLDAHLRQIGSNQFSFETLDHFGTTLARMVLTPEIQAVLPNMKKRPLVVVHDATASRIPWETIRLDGWAPALVGGLSRRYAAENLSVAKWLEERRYGKVLDLLLVVDPTRDLPGAEKEGTRIHEKFDPHPLVTITELRGSQATKPALKNALQSGRFDVVHYAGHAFFNVQRPSRSGLLCHGNEVLSGAELAGLGNLPGMVFFNACESGRIRGANNETFDVMESMQKCVGLAEAFLRGGVANYLGTYWPVGDQPALTFAELFYTSLLEGHSITTALLTARNAVARLSSEDWADYIHYGSAGFALKHKD